MTMSEPALNRQNLDLSTVYREPESSNEQLLAKIFCAAFNLDQIGIDDDFFELGGDSLVAAIICADAAAKLNAKIQPGLLSRNRTIRKLALKLELPAAESKILQQVQAGKPDRTPIFILPGNSGYTILRPAFLDTIGADTPVYAFQIPGLSSPAEFPATIDDLAKDFVQAIVALKHITNFHLVSFCGTGVVLLTMLEQLTKVGRAPCEVVLVDPSFSLALPLLREKNKRLGKLLPLSPSAFLRMKYHVLRKLGKWRAISDGQGNFLTPLASGKFIGGPEHRDQIRSRWAANFDGALAAHTAYSMLLKKACPPQYFNAAHVITSKWFWQGRSRSDVDAARVFVPNAKWHKLSTKTHSDLIVKDQRDLAFCLVQIFASEN